jgi:hypothetical protein
MTDRWRAQTRTNVAGKPVVLVEVQFSRTIICTEDTFEKIHGQMMEARLKEAAEFVKFAMQVPQNQRIFCNLSWTDADQKKFELQPFSTIVQWLDGISSLRIEGDIQQGYKLILTTSDRDIATPLNEQNIPQVIASLYQLKTDAQAEGDTALENICGDADSLIQPLGKLCEDLKAIREHQQKTEQEREEMERTDRELRDVIREPKETVRGDHIDRIERAMRTA